MLEFMLNWLECDSPGDVRETSERDGSKEFDEDKVKTFLESICSEDGTSFKAGGDIRNAVRAECEGYLPAAMENCTGFKEFDDQSNVHCSYNKDSHDFHIVPLRKDKAAENYVETCKKIFEITCGVIKKDLPFLEGFENSGKVKFPLTCHRFKYASDLNGRWQYLIGFNRLTCDDNRNVTNHLGLVQFMRYRIVVDKPTSPKNTINWSADRKFKMMYPSSAEDYSSKYDVATGHCVYNAPYMVNPDGKDANANAAEIAEAFVRFIRFFQDGKHEITGSFQ